MFYVKHPENMENNVLGRTGEEMAAQFLIKKGYSILFKNRRELKDEIDLITRHPEGILIFVEVKTLSAPSDGFSQFRPEDHFSKAKRYKMERACLRFANTHPELIEEESGWQMDLIALVINRGNILRITHLENI